MSDVKLGQLIDASQRRDAIHVAIAPVIAGQILQPGEHVGWMDNSHEKVGRVPDKLGIVDPYLTEPVMPGSRFWLCLYPQTVTSLRHEWTHPAFEPPLSNKEASELWLRAFVATSDCPGYEAVIAAAIGQGSRHPIATHLHFDGQDAHGEIPPEFWEHVEIVTGVKVPKRATHFSCSC